MDVRFRIPEIFLGALLAVAIFGLGLTFSAYGPETGHTGDQRAANESSQQYLELYSWNTTAIANVLIAAFTLALVVVAVLQFRALSTANAVARAAADAAVEANKITREIFVEGERPRMVFSHYQMKNSITLKQKTAKQSVWTGTIEIFAKNVGKQPAINVMIWPKLILLEPGGDYLSQVAQFVYGKQNIWLENTVLSGALHSHGGYRLEADDDVFAKETHKGGIGIPLVIGFIEYEFAFDRTRRNTPFVLIGAGQVKANSAKGTVADIGSGFSLIPIPFRPT